MCLPFRNPALLAKMAITTDEIAGGRLILGLGAGWHQPEFDAFGVPFHHLADQFEEGLRIISPLLREGSVDFSGAWFTAPDCEMRPRGPRPGGPPVLIAAKGPRMLRLTAQYADQWNSAWFGRPTVFRQRHADLLAACAEVGRDPATLEITAGVTIVYPEMEQGDLPEAFSDPDTALRGTPDDIAAALQEYAGLGVAHVICAPTPNTAESINALAKALRVYRG
jgi:alkanesulfonate monooxygenase SsuD/methylene tetrahydromethanopterin reductase-like flavin-dependent oxidoreductase (luciferase family)